MPQYHSRSRNLYILTSNGENNVSLARPAQFLCGFDELVRWCNPSRLRAKYIPLLNLRSFQVERSYDVGDAAWVGVVKTLQHGRKPFVQRQFVFQIDAVLPLVRGFRQCHIAVREPIQSHMMSLKRRNMTDHTAYVDYLAIRCPRKAVQLNHSLTHYIWLMVFYLINLEELNKKVT